MEGSSAVMSARKRDIRWGRVVLAALMAEAGVILIISAVFLVYRFWIAPGRTAAEYQEFGQLAGYYVAPIGSALTTFLSVLWATRPLKSDFVLNGLLIGVAGVLLTLAFIVTAKPEHRSMYVVSYVLRIVGGYLGGIAAKTRAARRPALA